MEYKAQQRAPASNSASCSTMISYSLILLSLLIRLTACSISPNASLSDPVQTCAEKVGIIHKFFREGVYEEDMEIVAQLSSRIPQSFRYSAISKALRFQSLEVFKYLGELWLGDLGKEEIVQLVLSSSDAESFIAVYETFKRTEALDQFPLLTTLRKTYDPEIIRHLAQSGYVPKRGEVLSLAYHFSSKEEAGKEYLSALIIGFPEELTLNELLHFTIEQSEIGSPGLPAINALTKRPGAMAQLSLLTSCMRSFDPEVIVHLARAGYKPKRGEALELAEHFAANMNLGMPAWNTLLVEFTEEFTLNDLLNFVIGLDQPNSPAFEKLISILRGITMTFKLKQYIISFILSSQIPAQFSAWLLILKALAKIGHFNLFRRFNDVKGMLDCRFLQSEMERIYKENVNVVTSDCTEDLSNTMFNVMDLAILANELDDPTVFRFVHEYTNNPFTIDPISRKNLVQLLEGPGFDDARQIVLTKMAEDLKTLFAFYLMLPEISGECCQDVMEHVIRFACLMKFERTMPVFKSIE